MKRNGAATGGLRWRFGRSGSFWCWLKSCISAARPSGCTCLRRGRLTRLGERLRDGLRPVYAVRDTHPLAERGYATVEDLADHSVIDRPGLPEVTRDALVPRTSPSGRSIERRYRADTTMDFLTLVARGAAVHPTLASSAAYMAFPGVTYVPLRGLPQIRSALVWRTAAESAAIRAFVLAAREVEEDPPSIDPCGPRSGASRYDERIGLDGPRSVIHRGAQ